MHRLSVLEQASASLGQLMCTYTVYLLSSSSMPPTAAFVAFMGVSLVISLVEELRCRAKWLAAAPRKGAGAPAHAAASSSSPQKKKKKLA